MENDLQLRGSSESSPPCSRFETSTLKFAVCVCVYVLQGHGIVKESCVCVCGEIFRRFARDVLVCVCVCVREGERERERHKRCVCEREFVCVCVW